MNLEDASQISYWNDQIINTARASTADSELKSELATYIREGHPEDPPFIYSSEKLKPSKKGVVRVGKAKHKNIGDDDGYETKTKNLEPIQDNVQKSTSIEATKSMIGLNAIFGKPHKPRGPKSVYNKYGSLLYEAKKFEKGELSLRLEGANNKPYDMRTNYKMSDRMQRKMRDLLSGKKKVDISDLPMEDQTFIKHFHRRSGVEKNPIVGDGLHTELQQSVKMLDKALGSIKAGNDSIDLRNKVNKALNTLMEHKVLSKEQVAVISETYLE